MEDGAYRFDKPDWWHDEPFLVLAENMDKIATDSEEEVRKATILLQFIENAKGESESLGQHAFPKGTIAFTIILDSEWEDLRNVLAKVPPGLTDVVKQVKVKPNALPLPPDWVQRR